MWPSKPGFENLGLISITESLISLKIVLKTLNEAQPTQSLSSKFMIYEIIVSVLPIHPTYCDAWLDSLTTEWVFTNFVCATFQFSSNINRSCCRFGTIEGCGRSNNDEKLSWMKYNRNTIGETNWLFGGFEILFCTILVIQSPWFQVLLIQRIR